MFSKANSALLAFMLIRIFCKKLSRRRQYCLPWEQLRRYPQRAEAILVNREAP